MKYDTPIQVTEAQYNVVMRKCSGIVAGRVDCGKFYIKLWMMKYSKFVLQILNSVN